MPVIDTLSTLLYLSQSQTMRICHESSRRLVSLLHTLAASLDEDIRGGGGGGYC